MGKTVNSCPPCSSDPFPTWHVGVLREKLGVRGWQGFWKAGWGKGNKNQASRCHQREATWFDFHEKDRDTVLTRCSMLGAFIYCTLQYWASARLNDLPKITQLIRSRVEIWTHFSPNPIISPQTLCLSVLNYQFLQLRDHHGSLLLNQS